MRLSKRQTIIYKISSRVDEDSIVQYLRDRAKNVPEVKEKFNEYGVDMSDLDDVTIRFCDMDVSAKTKNKKIFLNRILLMDKRDPLEYLVHELVHYLQQKTGKNMQKDRMEDEYLEKETEQEAFQAQISFKKRKDSPEEAERYVDNLLDYHDVDNKKERKEKKEILLDS